MQDEYRVYETAFMDYFDGYTHVSNITERIENFIRRYPRSRQTFDEIWSSILSKLYWAWTKCKFIDLDLRQPDFWVRFLETDDDLDAYAVIFKADNNGTVYSIINYGFDTKREVNEKLFHEFGDEWEEVSEQIVNERKERFKNWQEETRAKSKINDR